MSDEPFVDPADIAAEDVPLEPEVLEDDIDELPIDADPADAVDQRRAVPLDDDRDLLGDGDSLVDDRGGLGGHEL